MIRYWAASDLCARCAEASLHTGGQELNGSARIPRSLLLDMLNSIGAAASLIGGEIEPGAAPEILAMIAETVERYKALAADGGAPSLESLAAEMDRSGASDPGSGGGGDHPRLWRPGDRF